MSGSQRVTEDVLSRIETIVRRFEDATAVEDGPRAVSYGELWNGVAQAETVLLDAGVKAGDLVGLCAPRSVESLTAALAIWSARAAYLPLDGHLPHKRLVRMIRDADVRAVAVSSPGVREIFNDSAVDIIDLAGRARSSERPDAWSLRPSDLDETAYVLYTSGSTGTSKGVAVHHGALVEYVAAAADRYQIGPGWVAPWHTTLAFDLTVTSVFVPLAAGATISVVPEDGGIVALDEVLRRDSRPVMLKLTPSHLRLLSPDCVAADYLTLVIGGEELTPASAEPWRCRPLTTVINEYGPTEATVGCAVHEYRARAATRVPIGRALGRAQLAVCDEAGGVVSPGVPGELWVGGPGVSRGYIGSGTVTAREFPVRDDGQRWYRTGDEVVERRDGALDFLGRLDQQVKVRGHRVEPAEIVAALTAMPDVTAAHVRYESQPHPLLVAWVIGPVTGGLDAPAKLRAALAAELPDYMVPDEIWVVDRFPMTTNGKVDLEALRSERRSCADTAEPGRRDATVDAIWTAVLGEDTHPEVDFFDAGGNSLAALELVARLAEIDIPLTVRELVENSTLGHLTEYLGSRASNGKLLSPERQ